MAGNQGIDHGGGLVVENDLRLRGQGARHGHCTLASGGKAGRQDISHIFCPHQANQPVHDLTDLVFGQASALAQWERHIFAHAERVE